MTEEQLEMDNSAEGAEVVPLEGGKGEAQAEEPSWDPNIEASTDAIKPPDFVPEPGTEAEEVSPYPEVAAAVSPKDEEADSPVNTFRVWFLGMLFVTVGSGLNMLFSMRLPALIITSIVCQLLSFPLGKAMAKIPGPKWFNPGKFTMKEHTIITIMSNVSFAGGQLGASSIILVQKRYYDQDFGWGYQILLAISTQCALFRTLHCEGEPIVKGWNVSRYRFFLYVMGGSFVWYWFPGYLFQGLSAFAFITWIFPNNRVVNNVFGQFTGMSLVPITFDWLQVTGYITSPLPVPWWAILHVLTATIFWYWIVAPSMYFNNILYTHHMPFSDYITYDNTQAPYNVSRILNDGFIFDPAKYKAYSPIFLPTTIALVYGLTFASMSSVIVHTILYYGKDIIKTVRSSRNEKPDVYYKLSQRYSEVPHWWYITMFVVTFAASVVVVEAWPTHLPWWALLIAILISVVFFLPLAFIQAITGTQIGLVIEFIIGYMLPGRPVAMLLFRIYGFLTLSQAVAFVSDLKLGHYMKIPPRILFITQTTATVWACFVELGVMNWMLSNVHKICEPDQPDHYVCASATINFNVSMLWGVIGPANLFSNGNLYSVLLWFFLVGAIAPIPTWFLYRKYPNSFWKYINWPLFFGSTGAIPPATPLNYLSWAIIGLIFNKYIKTKYRGWWLKYNFVLSAGLDTGLALCTVFIFIITLSGSGPPSWWGNNVVSSTQDANHEAMLPIPPGKTQFGPDCWYDCKH